jgi:aminopeptidase
VEFEPEDVLIKPDYGAVANQLVRHSLRVLPGEVVTILGRADSLDFCEALELECRRLEAFPLVLVNSDASLLAALRDPQISEEQLAKPSPQLLVALEKSDIIITTFFERADPRSFHSADIDPQRYGALLRSEEAPSDIIYDGKRRWLGTEVPTPAQAAALGCHWPTLHNIYWKAMSSDYVAIGVIAERLRTRLNKTNRLHLLGDNGTDLQIELGGRPIECDDGVISERDMEEGAFFLNMPSGEVCFAPPETSATGRVFIEQAFWQGRAVRDLLLEFKNGKVEALEATEGLELFNEVINSSGGDSAMLGEFGIGLNPAVDRVLGFTLLDEKILGAAHIALGENRPLGGNNNSSLHWDLVIQHVTVLADDELILDKGKLLI